MRMTYKGELLDGRACGEGVATDGNQTIAGHWFNSKLEGRAIMTYAGTTDLEVCENRNNVYHGKVCCHYSNGVIENHIWKDDEQISNQIVELTKDMFYDRKGNLRKDEQKSIPATCKLF